MLVLTYQPWIDGKLSYLRLKRRSHKYSNLGRARIKLGTLWLEIRDLTCICANHAHPNILYLFLRKVERDSFGISFSGEKLLDLDFADDIPLIAGDNRELQWCTKSLIEVMGKTRLPLNAGKCEVVALNCEDVLVMIGKSK